MALTFLKVTVINPEDARRSRDAEFLVDSGAVYSVMPAAQLAALGIESSSHEEFVLANGERIKYPVGNAFFAYGGKTRAAPIIFGEPDVYLLGATTLEALGVVLDPIRRELRPLPMTLM
jgi:predicted aspartyl protease